MGIPQKTVYEREAELRNSQLFKAKSKRDFFENPFLEALRVANGREKSHFVRQETATRDFFQRHPENLHELFEIDWRDIQLRMERVVDVELRFGRGWWDRVTDDDWIGLPQQRFESRDWRWDLPPEETVSEMEYAGKQLELPLDFDRSPRMKIKAAS